MLMVVIPGLTRNPVQSWIPASAGMTILIYIVAGVIKCEKSLIRRLRTLFPGYAELSPAERTAERALILSVFSA
jgi:hypothetical protein